jgi:hypothetical protein
MLCKLVHAFAGLTSKLLLQQFFYKNNQGKYILWSSTYTIQIKQKVQNNTIATTVHQFLRQFSSNQTESWCDPTELYAC